MNLTLRALSAALLVSRSPFMTRAISSLHSSLYLSSCAFRRFASPVLMTSPLHRLTVSSFNSLFVSAKAISMDADDDDRSASCSDRRNEAVDHMTVDHICVDFSHCTFTNCTSAELGGAIDANHCNMTFTFCAFTQCSAKYGGSIYMTHCKTFVLNTSTITQTHAERFGAFYSDAQWKNRTTNIRDVNISHSSADVYIAAVRVEVTTPIFFNVQIAHTYAPTFGALWDWSTLPSVASYIRCKFVNASSDSEGSSMTFFHWMHHSVIQSCQFVQGKGPSPKYIYVYSCECVIEISNSYFDAPRAMSIGDRYGNNTITIADDNEFIEAGKV